jgi:hypothetical protein
MSPESVQRSRKAVRGCRGLAVRFSLLLVAGSLALVACAAPGSTPNAGPSSTAPSPIEETVPPNAAEGPPRVNWDNPFGNDSVNLTADAANPAALKAHGGLTFTPVVPRFGVKPFIIQSSSTQSPPENREIIFAYNFGTGPDFPVNGHVAVTETGAHPTPMDVAGRVSVDSNMIPGASVSAIIIGKSIPAYYVVRSADNTAEIEMDLRTSEGYVHISIYGPSLPSSMCRRLADTFAS